VQPAADDGAPETRGLTIEATLVINNSRTLQPH